MTAQERRITVVGSGPAGLTVGAGLASLGHRVVLCPAAVSGTQEHEPRLPELVRHGLLTGRLRFVREVTDGMADPDTVFVCADLRTFDALARAVPRGCVVVNASTSSRERAETLHARLRPGVPLVSNPLFLRTGTMVRDFLQPDRIVIGADTRDAAEHVSSLYRSVRAPLVRTDVRSAELVGHAVDGYFALKQCYINALGGLCTAVGADIDSVAEALAYDDRIGDCAMTPAPLPTDLRHSLELLSQAAEPGQELLHSAVAFDRPGSGPHGRGGSFSERPDRDVDPRGGWCACSPAGSSSWEPDTWG
ncbi:UDP-glucose/GDP-mannose dehydrogenase family protein [Halopolyspora algeriensis]|uniref:UDP-glucose 6-dehydrogenase n=1 Tax=Halopolyspora algeriensis TaxID=1500506 RepID=A0A368VTU6_9ACTN|nr:UDP-glucose/GDP-mannose dehydrogenase family protein [Halopolyspora algeriensis]RCW44616.1 UDP-glucose/GDP-mannose dehydrogenase family protein [Halopolyspora algeriensis]TQM55977.1 UDP-glucose/GDP-mannose dehydrogenase family protein [Halopolyspora algeriensis]